MRKRGQVTIFVIIAIVIIAAVILTYVFYPKIKAPTELSVKNPSAFIQSCLEDKRTPPLGSSGTRYRRRYTEGNSGRM